MADRIRIVSDGTTQGTHVYGPDGEPLPGVVSLALVANPNHSPIVQALVGFTDYDLDVTAEMLDEPADPDQD